MSEIDPSNGAADDTELEARLRRALTSAMEDVVGDQRLDAEVQKRRATARTRQTGMRWTAAAAVLVLLAGSITLVTLERNSTKHPTIVFTGTTTSTGLDNPTSTTQVTRPPEGTWTPIPAAPITGRSGSASAKVWTGTELIIWGMGGGTNEFVGTRQGAAYSPSRKMWRPIAVAPLAPTNTAAVWTGTEMIVGPATEKDGSTSSNQAPGSRGDSFYAAYDPVADSWRIIPGGPLEADAGQPLLWTGTRLIVSGDPYNPRTSSALDPITGAITQLPEVPSSGATSTGRPSDASGGGFLNLDGGQVAARGGGPTASASLYISNPSLSSWVSQPQHATKLGVDLMTVWTGDELVSVPYAVEPEAQNNSVAYNPKTKQWRDLDAALPIVARTDEARWLQQGALAAGHFVFTAYGVLDTDTNRWTLPAIPPDPTTDAIVVWTGSQVLVWSGIDKRDTGWAYAP